MNNIKNKSIDYCKFQKEIFENPNHNLAILGLVDYKKYVKDNKKNNNLKLSGLTFAIKDNIAIADTEMTLGSKILKDFIPNYSSTVFEKLINEGAIPLFKSNLDELAMGGTGLSSGFNKKVNNPFDKSRIIGGSSSGSAYLVATDIVDFALGSDTGDSVRKPAAYSGIVGFKPTWGLVSRYGLSDFAPSWDTIGWFTKDVGLSAKLLDILQGQDRKDYSSIDSREHNFYNDLNKKSDKKIKIGVIGYMLEEIIDKEIFEQYKKILKKLDDDNNYEVIYIDLNHKAIDNILVTYRIISSVEGFSSNSNLTGFIFGNYFDNDGKTFEEKIINSRSKTFSYEVKKRFLFAAESIINNERVYSQAKKVRYLIVKELERIFDSIDALAMPSNASFAPKKVNDDEDILSYKSHLDNYLGLFNANGSPSITLPIYKQGYKIVAINISTAPFQDKKCLQIAKKIEDLVKENEQ